MIGSRHLVALRTHALGFAVVLSPVALQAVPPGCEPGDGTLSTLELEVAGQNQIAFDPVQVSYSIWLPVDVESVLVRAYSTDPTATVWYKLEAAATLAHGKMPNGGGELTLETVPLGHSTMTIQVTSSSGVLWGTYTVGLNVDPRPPERELVTFQIDDPELYNENFHVYVLGDLPELGANDITRAVKLVSDGATHWEVTVSLPVNRTYAYQLYQRLYWRPADPDNAYPIGASVTTSTQTVPVLPPAKVVYAHSAFDSPIVHWRQGEGAFQQVTMEEIGTGRTAGEKRWVAGPFGEAHKSVELYLTSSDGTERDPLGTATYETPLDAFFVQDEQLFGYEPAASVSAPRRDYEVLSDGFSSTRITSSILADDYEYRVFLPRGYEEHSSRRYPVLYLQDGGFSWDEYWGPGVDPDAATTSSLIASGVVGELILVAVDNVVPDLCGYVDRRARDYLPPGSQSIAGGNGSCDIVEGEGDRYASFLIEELKPFIDSHYRTFPDATHTFNSGFSYGATFAFYVGWDFDDTFTRVGAQSMGNAGNVTYFSRIPDDPKPISLFYLDAAAEGEPALRVSLEIRDALLSRIQGPFVLGRDLQFFAGEVPGHNRPAAGSRWPEMLTFLYPATDRLPECYDGIDNDGDGLVDHVPGAPNNDPGCTSALDLSE